jgi:hypothetical protein
MTMAIEIFRLPQTASLCHLFEKTSLRVFQKNDMPHFFLAIEKIQLPSDNGGVWDGDRKNVVTI